MDSAKQHLQHTSENVDFAVPCSKLLVKISRDRATYLDAVLRDSAARRPSVARMNIVEKGYGDDSNEAVPIPPSDEPSIPPIEPPPALTEEHLTKLVSSFATTRTIRCRYNSSMTAVKQSHVEGPSLESLQIQEVTKKDCTSTLSTSWGSPEIKATNQRSLTSLKHSTPKPHCHSVYQSTVNVARNVPSASSATARTFSVDEKQFDRTSLTYRQDKTELFNSSLNTRSASTPDNRKDDNELMGNAVGKTAGAQGFTDSVADTTRASRDYRRMGKDDHAYGVGVVVGDNRYRGEGGDGSLCEDRRALYRGADVFSSCKYTEAERCAEADTVNVRDTELPTSTSIAEEGTLKGHNVRRRIILPQLRPSALQPQRQSTITMGARNSKKLPQARTESHSNTEATQDNWPTADDSLQESIEIR